MKNTFFLLFIFVSQAILSQSLELIETPTGLPFGELTLVQSQLYRGGVGQEVARIAISDDTYPVTVVATGPSTSSTFLRSTVDAQEQNVYLANVSGQIFTAPIANGSVSTFSPVIANDVEAIGLAIADNTLYFVTLSSQILSLNVTDPENTVAVVYDPPNALPIFNIHLAGNFLYYSTRSSFNDDADWQVFRLDVSINNPLPQLVAITTNRIWTMANIGDFLYLGSDDTNKISRVAINSSLPTTEETVFSSLPLTSDDDLFSIAHDGSFLYFSSTSGIYRVADNALSQEEFASSSFSLYPNPVSKVLYINTNDANALLYRIYDSNGKKVLHGNLGLGEKSIEISSLENGVYFLKMISTTNSITLRFIKE